MEEKLRSPGGKELYRKRGITIEPIFGHIKEVLGFRRFMRRGLEACGNEWKLMCMAHKAYVHGTQPAQAMAVWN
jgi:hypothetical protein